MSKLSHCAPASGWRRCAIVLIVAFTAAIPLQTAGAVEVVVKNDSIVEGSQAAIQAGFVANEAAAAWLTAPCDGTIVAVQIYWRSLAGNAGQTIEDSITVYAAGGFPFPGAELALLEAPLMTDGFLNEFRYLDKNNTNPLSIPIAAGEKFIVSFRFFNTPGLGGASVVTDTDGCQAGKNAIDEISLGWFSSCFFGVSGDFFIRAVIDCGDVPEACCLGDGSCALQLSDDCLALGGAPQGVGSCAGVVCDQACCFQGGGCIDFDLQECLSAGGFSQGAGTACATIKCFASGACCLPEGTCGEDVLQEDCINAGGIFQGPDSLCMDAKCPQPLGACCFPTGFCTELPEATCTPAGATWAGPFTDCADADENGTADACEASNCPTDINGSGVTDFQDLLLLLAGWGPCPACPEDLDDDDVVGFQDLLMLLSSWGDCT